MINVLVKDWALRFQKPARSSDINTQAATDSCAKTFLQVPIPLWPVLLLFNHSLQSQFRCQMQRSFSDSSTSPTTELSASVLGNPIMTLTLYWSYLFSVCSLHWYTGSLVPTAPSMISGHNRHLIHLCCMQKELGRKMTELDFSSDPWVPSPKWFLLLGNFSAAVCTQC